MKEKKGGEKEKREERRKKGRREEERRGERREWKDKKGEEIQGEGKKEEGGRKKRWEEEGECLAALVALRGSEGQSSPTSTAFATAHDQGLWHCMRGLLNVVRDQVNAIKEAGTIPPENESPTGPDGQRSLTPSWHGWRNIRTRLV